MLYTDFKGAVILLTQHPIIHKSYDDLTDSEKDYAYDLVSSLVDLSVCERYSLLDYVQMSRLYFILGRLAVEVIGDLEKSLVYYSKGYDCLCKGGFDLGLPRWLELVSYRTLD